MSTDARPRMRGRVVLSGLAALALFAGVVVVAYLVIEALTAWAAGVIA